MNVSTDPARGPVRWYLWEGRGGEGREGDKDV